MTLEVVADGAGAVSRLGHLIAQFRNLNHLFHVAQAIRPLSEFVAGDGAKLATIRIGITRGVEETPARVDSGAGPLLGILLLRIQAIRRACAGSAGTGLLRFALSLLLLLLLRLLLGVALILVLRLLPRLAAALSGLLRLLILLRLAGLLGLLLLIRLALPPPLTLTLPLLLRLGVLLILL